VHRHGVDELVLEGDVGIILSDLRNRGAPELRNFKDVGLIDRGDLLAALTCEFEGDAGYTDDLVAGVTHGVNGFVGLFVPGAGGAEVEAAEQLADKEDIDIFRNLRTQRRAAAERLVGDRGAKVGKTAERLANLQQTGFGTLVGSKRVELVVAHGPEQDGVGVERGVECSRRKRRAGLGDGRSADEAFDEGEVMAAEFGYGAQDVGGFTGDFRADAVSGEDCNFQAHLASLKFPGLKPRVIRNSFWHG